MGKSNKVLLFVFIILLVITAAELFYFFFYQPRSIKDKNNTGEQLKVTPSINPSFGGITQSNDKNKAEKQLISEETIKNIQNALQKLEKKNKEKVYLVKEVTGYINSIENSEEKIPGFKDYAIVFLANDDKEIIMPIIVSKTANPKVQSLYKIEDSKKIEGNFNDLKIGTKVDIIIKFNLVDPDDIYKEISYYHN